MAKKKRSQRKRNLAYARHQANKQQLHSQVSESSPKATDQSRPAAVKPSRAEIPAVINLPFLRQDLRKILILATACISLELILWILLQHTSLGVKVFGG